MWKSALQALHERGDKKKKRENIKKMESISEYAAHWKLPPISVQVLENTF